jgi:TRAP-type mannitol/chloroaromatic compound transport system permease small subunit
MAAVLVLFGYADAGLWIGITTAGLATIIWLVNLSAQLRAESRGQSWLPPVIALVVVALPLAAQHWTPSKAVGSPGELGRDHTYAVLAMTVLACAIFSVMWLSTTVDRCYVLPRLAGGKGKRPCTHSLDSCWRLLTRLWFLHRLFAAVTLVASTIAIVTIAANEWVLSLNQVVAAALAAATTVLGGFYLTRLPFAVAMIANPPVNVGDKVLLAEMFSQSGDLPYYYVSEISLEGVKLVELDGAHRTRRQSDRPYDRLLDLGDIHKLLRIRDAFTPCRECKGVNAYCGRPHPGRA